MGESGIGWRTTAGIAAAVLVAGAVAVSTALATSASGAETGAAAAAARPASDPGRPRVYQLPGGDRVHVTGTGDAVRASLLPAPGHSSAAITTVLDGRLTVVPASAVHGLSSLSAYQVEGPAPQSAA